MTEIFGSIRDLSCNGALIVLSDGIYIRFQLDFKKQLSVQNLIEVARYRKGISPRVLVPVIDADLYMDIKRGVYAAIARHRTRMYIPERERPTIGVQLEFRL